MYNIHPTLATDKPAFLVEKHEGKMPCLVHKGESMTDSLAIAEFLEKMYPEPNLSRAGLFSYSEVMQKTSGFFPALSAYIKNKDETVEESLKADISAQLDIIDEVRERVTYKLSMARQCYYKFLFYFISSLLPFFSFFFF